MEYTFEGLPLEEFFQQIKQFHEDAKTDPILAGIEESLYMGYIEDYNKLE